MVNDKLSEYLMEPGLHTARSPVVGSRVDEFYLVINTVRANSWLDDFEEVLYKPELAHLIPADKKEQADEFAKTLFVDYIKKYEQFGFNIDNIFVWSDGYIPGFADNFNIFDEDSDFFPGEWGIAAFVTQLGIWDVGKFYTPEFIVAYHEIMHIEETPKNVKNINHLHTELMTRIKTVMLEDEVYKKVHNIGLDEEVNYGKVVSSLGRSISLGKLANFYRNLEAAHGKIGYAIASRESLDFLSDT